MAYNLNSPELQSAAASKLHAAYANLLESSNKQHMLSILFPDCMNVLPRDATI